MTTAPEARHICSSGRKLGDHNPTTSLANDKIWSAVASVARHRFGFTDRLLSSFNQSAAAASLCRTPNGPQGSIRAPLNNPGTIYAGAEFEPP
jgi:hypothetical protein